MKICLISNLYEPYTRGGAENVVKTMAEGLKARGEDVLVISTKPKSGLKQKTEAGIRIYRFKPLNIFYYINDHKWPFFIRIFWHIFDLFNFFAAKTVKKILQKEKPDLIITHNLKGLSLRVPKVIRDLGIKHFHYLHDVQLSVPSGLLIKGKEKSFMVQGWPIRKYERLCKKTFGSPEKVISPSVWLADFYTEKGFFPNSQIKIINNPVSGKIKSEPKKSKNKRYLFIGQWEKHKGLDWLINFWQENEIDSELLIVGSGNLKPKDQKNIKILGRKHGSELEKNFQKVDFLLIPSLCYENSPTVIPLAYQNGVPVIGAKIGGISELIESGETGFTFSPGNKKDLYYKFSKAEDLIDQKFNEFSENCLKKAKEFTEENFFNDFYAFID